MSYKNVLFFSHDCRVSLDKMDALALLDLVDPEDSLESWDSLDLRELL